MKVLIVVICLCGAEIVAAQEPECSLEFSIPEGWVPTSESADAARIRYLEREAEKSLGRVAVSATRTSHHGVDTYMAIIVPKPVQITEGSLDVLARETHSQVTGSALTKIMQQSVFEIDGVQAGKFILGEPNVWGARAVLYYVPGGSCTGLIVCNTNGSALREIFDELDAAVMRTAGVVAAPDPGFLFKLRTRQNWRTSLLYIGIFMVAVVAAFELLVKRRRRS